jgi:peroxiredoxin
LKKIFLSILLILILSCQQKIALDDQGPAADFRLHDTDSVFYQLKNYRGKIVMVHFWADWCPSCRGEFPKIQQAYNQLKDRNFELLAINSGQTAAHVRDIKQTYQLTYPLLVDREAKTAETYRVAGLPSTYYVNENGQIVRIVVGWITAEEIIATYREIDQPDRIR